MYLHNVFYEAYCLVPSLGYFSNARDYMYLNGKESSWQGEKRKKSQKNFANETTEFLWEANKTQGWQMTFQ